VHSKIRRRSRSRRRSLQGGGAGRLGAGAPHTGGATRRDDGKYFCWATEEGSGGSVEVDWRTAVWWWWWSGRREKVAEQKPPCFFGGILTTHENSRVKNGGKKTVARIVLWNQYYFWREFPAIF
jgi:hypothetical protein